MLKLYPAQCALDVYSYLSLFYVSLVFSFVTSIAKLARRRYELRLLLLTATASPFGIT